MNNTHNNTIHYHVLLVNYKKYNYIKILFLVNKNFITQFNMDPTISSNSKKRKTSTEIVPKRSRKPKFTNNIVEVNDTPEDKLARKLYFRRRGYRNRSFNR